MTKYYCNTCGNTLFFKKIIEGTIAIPMEIDDDECEIYNTRDMEFRDIYYEQIECVECGNVDIEEDKNDDPLESAPLREEDEKV